MPNVLFQLVVVFSLHIYPPVAVAAISTSVLAATKNMTLDHRYRVRHGLVADASDTYRVDNDDIFDTDVFEDYGENPGVMSEQVKMLDELDDDQIGEILMGAMIEEDDRQETARVRENTARAAQETARLQAKEDAKESKVRDKEERKQQKLDRQAEAAERKKVSSREGRATPRLQKSDEVVEASGSTKKAARRKSKGSASSRYAVNDDDGSGEDV